MPNTRPPTFDHLKKKQPVEERVPIVLSDDGIEALAEARILLARAESMARSDSPEDEAKVAEAKAAVDKAEKQVEAATVVFRFRSVGRDAWRKIKEEHPPTEAQRAAVKKEFGPDAEPEWNTDTFPAVAISATCVEPAMTVEQVQELFDSPDWNDVELGLLIKGAVDANSRTRVGDLGKYFGGTGT